MEFGYYPGCTLKTKAKDLDLYARRAAEALGATLKELPDWQCCGAVYPLAKDEIATKLSAVRSLASAKALEQDLVTLCSACHNVLKQVNHDMQTNEDIIFRANNYLKLEEPYRGETKVVHYLEMLRDEVGFEAVKEKVVAPLAGKKIAAYYGCLLLRPSKVMQMDDPENPQILEQLMAALGASPVSYALRNECCGAYVTMEDENVPKKHSERILENAKANGAEMIVTACPLCYYNLKKNGGEILPVYYFTELLAEALGVK